MGREALPALLAAIAFAGAVAPAASGSTVHVVRCDSSDRYNSCDDYAVLTAGAGEANDVSAQWNGTVAHVVDTGATLAAGSGCKSVGPHEATCDAELAEIHTGDGDDHVAADAGEVQLGPGDDRLEGGYGSADGGPGNDTMVGGSGQLSWNGGPGNDVLEGSGGNLDGGPGDDSLQGSDASEGLSGGPGRDVLHAGGGDDHLDPDAGDPEDDVVDGGPGRDSVSYRNHREPVMVDLGDPAPDGSAGEHDQLESIERVYGSRGDDVLAGDGKSNVLVGGPGDDVLTGAGGADQLVGGEGFDRFDAGAGNDKIVSSGDDYYWSSWSDHYSVDPTAEPVACGSGRDVLQPTLLDIPASDCESARLLILNHWARFALHPAGFGRGRVFLRVPCPRDVRKRKRCAGRLVVQAHGTYGEAKFSVPAKGGRVGVHWDPDLEDRTFLAQVDMDYSARPLRNGRRWGPYGLHTYLTIRPPAARAAR